MEKILIADDNLQITKVLSEFVKKEGYEPVIAEDGEAGWPCSARIITPCCCLTS